MRNSERSILKNIPISELDMTMRLMKACSTKKVRIMYRGPRVTAVGDTRDRYSKQLSCLKRFATTFAVYPDTRKTKHEVGDLFGRPR